jgi:hypothetical protein
MCVAQRLQNIDPEQKLATLMNRELGSAINKRELRLFIKAHWSKISTLAHAIHDTEYETDAQN